MKWRCKSNGVIIELDDNATNEMLFHEGYEQVLEEIAEKKPAKKPSKKPSKKPFYKVDL